MHNLLCLGIVLFQIYFKKITNHICFTKEGKALQANSFNYRILALNARLFVPTQNHDFSSKHALEKEKQQNSTDRAYRNRQNEINTPIRAFMANISNGSSHADADISLRSEIGESFRE